MARSIYANRRAASLTGGRAFFANLFTDRRPNPQEACLHLSINWRSITDVAADGQLHAVCACGADVARFPFVSKGAAR